MEQQPPVVNSTPPVKHWRFAISGCLALVSFLVVLLVGIVLFAYHSPFYRHMAECKIQIEQVAAALNRYSVKNDVYPEKLDQLAPEYISRQALHCPGDLPNSDTVSYIYHKPRPDSTDDFVTLECMHHKSKRAAEPTVIYCRKDESSGLARQR